MIWDGDLRKGSVSTHDGPRPRRHAVCRVYPPSRAARNGRDREVTIPIPEKFPDGGETSSVIVNYGPLRGSGEPAAS